MRHVDPASLLQLSWHCDLPFIVELSVIGLLLKAGSLLYTRYQKEIQREELKQKVVTGARELCNSNQQLTVLLR